MSTRSDPGSAEVRPGDVVGVSVVRNENLRLPYFLEYHRALGVDRFVVIDNDSSDGTHEYLVRQPDVVVYRTDQGYAESGYGTAWVDEVLSRHAVGHWVLILDADELLVYPDSETVDLHRLTEQLERAGAQTMRAFLLDMYPDGPIADAQYERGRPLLESAPYFDADSYHERDTVGLPRRGGPRHRLFWRNRKDSTDSPWLTKYPLIRWRDDLRFSSAHNPPDAVEASVTGALLHFKLLGDLHARTEAEVGRGEHWRAAAEYSSYWEVLGGSPGLSARYSGSRRYESSAQLVAMGLLRTGDEADAPLTAADDPGGTGLPAGVEPFLRDPPRLHGQGEHRWPGGCQDLARPMLHLITGELARTGLRVIETGAGLSTLALLAMGWDVTSVAPDEALGQRIERYADDHGLDRSRWEYIADRSELALPGLLDRTYDVALMDGGRGWPTVFVDFCYLNAMLRTGGMLLIDDAQLHSVRELIELLRAQPGYRLVRDRSKLRAFVKESERRFLPDFEGQPYLADMPVDWAAGPRSAPTSPEDAGSGSAVSEQALLDPADERQ